MQSSRLSPYIVCLFTLFPFQFLHVCKYIVGPAFKIQTFSTGSRTFSGCKCLSSARMSQNLHHKLLTNGWKLQLHRCTGAHNPSGIFLIQAILFWRQNSEPRPFFPPFCLLCIISLWNCLGFFSKLFLIFSFSHKQFLSSHFKYCGLQQKKQQQHSSPSATQFSGFQLRHSLAGTLSEADTAWLTVLPSGVGNAFPTWEKGDK